MGLSNDELIKDDINRAQTYIETYLNQDQEESVEYQPNTLLIFINGATNHLRDSALDSSQNEFIEKGRAFAQQVFEDPSKKYYHEQFLRGLAKGIQNTNYSSEDNFRRGYNFARYLIGKHVLLADPSVPEITTLEDAI